MNTQHLLAPTASIWQSTSDFIPSEPGQAYGAIPVGDEMTMEFDWTWHGRARPGTGDWELFFRVGFDPTISGGCDGRGSRYPSLWLPGTTDEMHLSISSGEACQAGQRFDNFGILSTGTEYHVHIHFDPTSVTLRASKTSDWPNNNVVTQTYSRNPTSPEFVGQNASMWWISPGWSTTVNYAGAATFRNVVLTSVVYSAAGTPAPTSAAPTTPLPTTTSPTTLTPTTAAPTTSAPTAASPTTASPTTATPTLMPTTSEPTTAEPTTVEPTTVEPTTSEPTTLVETTVHDDQDEDEDEDQDGDVDDGAELQSSDGASADAQTWTAVGTVVAVFLVGLAGVFLVIYCCRKQKNEDEVAVDLGDLLSDSTHNYLLRHDVTSDLKLLGYLVLVVQLGCYIVLLMAVLGDAGKHTVPVEVDHTHCGEDEHLDNSVTISDLYCEVNDVQSNLVAIVAGLLIVMSFVAPDVFAALRIFKHNLMVSFLLLVESGVAVLVATLLIFETAEQGAIQVMAAGVGVIFVHDIDEKIKSAVDQIAQRWKCCCCCRKHCPTSNLILLAIYFVVGFAINLFFGSMVYCSANGCN